MNSVCYALTKLVSWLVFRLGFRLEVSGQAHVPKHGAFILASNHVSFLDPPLVGVACPRPLCFTARADLFDKPVLGTFLRSVGALAVRRGEADVMAIRAAVTYLRRGKPVAIFPEGGRQLSGTLGRAKAGVGLLADLAQVPIIPVVVHGTFQALPPHATRLHPAKIRVAFGQPIPYTSSSFSLPEHQGLEGRRGVRPTRRHREALAEAVTREWQRLAAQLNR